MLVGIITPHRDVTERGLGQRPTFTADSLTIQVQGAALPAAVLIIIGGIEYVRSAVTEHRCPVVALIPAHGSILLSVGAGVGVAGERAASPAVAPLALAALVLSRLVHLSRAPGLRLKSHHYLHCG